MKMAIRSLLYPTLLGGLFCAAALPAQATSLGNDVSDLKGLMQQFPVGQIVPQLTQNALPMMQNYLENCRNQLLQTNPRPIPEAIQAALAEEFDEDLLNEVRYVSEVKHPACMTQTLFNRVHARAVTFIDVIAFRGHREAETNVALWAHELVHVEQFRDWGVQGFIRRYIQNVDSVEKPGYEMQRMYERLHPESRKRYPPTTGSGQQNSQSPYGTTPPYAKSPYGESPYPSYQGNRTPDSFSEEEDDSYTSQPPSYRDRQSGRNRQDQQEGGYDSSDPYDQESY